MGHKSQAALEFLTTYGWAFLVLLIIISALAYFGVLSPSKLLPDKCTFGEEFECSGHQISASVGTFKLRLKNNVGEAIDVSQITLSTEGSVPYLCTGALNPPFPYNNWKSGNITDFSWSGCSGGDIFKGQKGKVLITIRYNTVNSGAGYVKESKGEAFATVI